MNIRTSIGQFSSGPPPHTRQSMLDGSSACT
jgi:hypothetical protein